jgi:hypothetical protein
MKERMPLPVGKGNLPPAAQSGQLQNSGTEWASPGQKRSEIRETVMYDVLLETKNLKTYFFTGGGVAGCNRGIPGGEGPCRL